MYEGSHLNQCFNGEKEESANYAATFKGFTVLEEFMQVIFRIQSVEVCLGELQASSVAMVTSQNERNLFSHVSIS